ncbi:MAG TPA: hypothetical protein PKA41_06585 [Verrucomicrobiota bacterium]|nr:hypothetical protein [Verrucomicrobiota bacterium]
MSRAIWYQKSHMRSICYLLLGVLLSGWLVASAQAQSYELTDGSTISGEIILPASADGLNFRLAQGKYQRVPWDKFTQAALLELAKNPKLVTFVEPFIEPPEEERVKKTEIIVKPVERLERLEKGSLIGALFGTTIGLVALLLIYAGNLYSAYEISVVKAQSPLTVCGVCAALPVIGQIIFLCLPTRVEAIAEKEADQAAAREAAVAQVQASIGASAKEAGIQIARHSEAFDEQKIPETQVFSRGKFTFNRRFFETKFSGFFGVVRREADKDLTLTIKSARGEYQVQRISRITGNEMHLEVRKGGAAQEVTVPFTEVTEVQLKHKDAA